MHIELIWIAKLVVAGLLALPVAWDREARSRSMGLRTFPLVAVGACAYMLIGMELAGPDSPDTVARVLQGLLSGIGFVGGGAIIKYKDHVLGTASAASIWVTGALGAAVGLGQWEIAMVLSVINFLVVRFLSGVKREIEHEPEESRQSEGNNLD